MKIRFNKGFNVQRLAKRFMWTIISLFVGGLTLTYFIKAMNGTCSVFYNGLSFIGVSVGGVLNSTGGVGGTLGYSYCTSTGTFDQNTIYSPTISTSVLSVVGIVAIATVLLSELIKW